MITFLIAAFVAGGVALLRGGSLKALGETQFRYLWLVFGGLALQLIADFASPSLGEGPGVAIVLLANLAIVGFLIGNRHLPGMILIGVGLMLNVLVISLNGGMPVSTRAAEIAGFSSEDLDNPGVEHERLDDETILPWLGDAIPIPGTQVVLSVGDVVLGIGVADLVYRRTISNKRGKRAARGTATSD